LKSTSPIHHLTPKAAKGGSLQSGFFSKSQGQTLNWTKSNTMREPSKPLATKSMFFSAKVSKHTQSDNSETLFDSRLIELLKTDKFKLRYQDP